MTNEADFAAAGSEHPEGTRAVSARDAEEESAGDAEEESARDAAATALARASEPSAAASAGQAVERAWQTVRRMVLPGGCAWHGEQTHESLLPYLTEEAAEFTDAVDRQLSAEVQAEELGDVLYQVLVHAAVAERDGEGYGLADVAARQDAKLRARHPHVFGSMGHMSAAELEREWEHLKEAAAGEKRGSRGVFAGIPLSMPTLMRAQKMLSRLSRSTGLSAQEALSQNLLLQAAPTQEAVMQDVPAQAAPMQASPDGAPVPKSSGRSAEEEFGQELLGLVARAHDSGINVDAALRHALLALQQAHQAA